MGSYIYYCPTCRRTFKSDGIGKNVKCSQCSQLLYDLNISSEDFSTLSSEEKKELRKKITANTSNSENGEKKPILHAAPIKNENTQNPTHNNTPTQNVKPKTPTGNYFCGECGCKLAQGAKFCPNCGRSTKPQIPPKKAPQKKGKKSSHTKIGIIVAIVLIIFIFPKSCKIIREYRKTAKIEKAEATIPNQKEISPDKILLTGIISRCFKPYSSNTLFELDKDNDTLKLRMELVCEKSLSSEIESQLKDSNISKNVKDPSSAYFRFNGDVRISTGKYSKEDMAATAAFEKLLTAKEGDIVDIELMTKYNSYSIKYISELLQTDSVFFSLDLNYYDYKDGKNNSVDIK